MQINVLIAVGIGLHLDATWVPDLAPNGDKQWGPNN
jgi:hypothetical protein